MRVLQGKRGSGGVSIWGPTGQDRLSTGQDLGGPMGVRQSKKELPCGAGRCPWGPTGQGGDPLQSSEVPREVHSTRRSSPIEQRGAHGCPTGQWQLPPRTRPSPPSLSPPLTLAAAPAAAVLALAGPGAGAGVTWGASEGERSQPGVRQPGVRRESAGTGRGTYQRHTCSPGGPWLGSARLGSA